MRRMIRLDLGAKMAKPRAPGPAVRLAGLSTAWAASSFCQNGVRVDFRAQGYAMGPRSTRIPSMARHGRYFLPDQPLRVSQRGNNRGAIFFAAADYEQYRAWLAEAAAQCGCLVHAYVLMTNHVHLLVPPARAESLPRVMQSLGRRYVRAINAAYRRSGTLWEGRYRAAPI